MPTLNEYLAGVRASADLPDTSGWSDYNTPGAWTSVKRGFGSGVGAIGSMLRDVAPDVGGAVETWGQDVAKFNPRQYATSADVLSSPFSAVAEQVPETLGQVLPAALALLVTKNPLAAGAVMGGTSYAQNVGETRARQRELGQDTPDDALRAYAYGVPQAGLDVLFGPEAALMKMFSKSVGKGMTEAGARELAERGLLKTVGVEGAKAAAFEAPTEIGQSVLGRLATRESLTDASAAEEYFMSGFAGLAGGGGMGAVTGPMTRANASKLVDQIDQARSVLDQPITNAQDMVLARQAGQFLESVAGNDFGLKAAEEMSRQHVAQLNDANLAILSDIADKEYTAGLTAERAAIVDGNMEFLRQKFDEMKQAAAEQEAALKDAIPYTETTLSDVSPAEPAAAPVLDMPAVEFQEMSQPQLPGLPFGVVPEPAAPARFDLADQYRAFLTQMQPETQQLPDMLAALRQVAGGRTPQTGFGPRGGVTPEAKAPKQTKADKRAAEAQAVWAQAQESGLTPEQLVVVKAGVDDLSIPVKEIKDRVDQFRTENANAEPQQDTQPVETPPSQTTEGQAAKGKTAKNAQGQATKTAEDLNAVQEPSTTSVDVQPEAKDGEALGVGDAQGQEVAEKGVETDPDAALDDLLPSELRNTAGDDGAGFRIEPQHGPKIDVANALEARDVIKKYKKAYSDLIEDIAKCKRGR